MKDVTHFMGQDAADFIFIEEIHDPCRCRYGCVGRISSGRKGVGTSVGMI